MRNFRDRAEKAEQDLLRQKLEELFTAVQNFGAVFSDIVILTKRWLLSQSLRNQKWLN
jgi:hypothetical protein